VLGEGNAPARLHEKEYVSGPRSQSTRTKAVVFRYQGLAESERPRNLFGAAVGATGFGRPDPFVEVPLRVGCVSSTPREADIERPSAPVRGARRPSGEDCESADEASPTISGVAVDRRPAHGLLDADLGLLAVLVLLGEDAGTTS
jgi:hypothetical protein